MVLIVDDRNENIIPLRKILELAGFKVDSALSGEEALKKVLKNNYMLIILDVQMPEMDGFEVAEALAGFSKGKNIPIIFLSAVNTDKRFITKGYQTGAIDYVTKPVDPEILVLKAKTFYRLHEQTKALMDLEGVLRSEIESRRLAQEELKSTLQAIPQVAFVLNPSGKIEYSNSQWLRYADTATAWPVMHPDDRERFSKAITNAFADTKPLEIEVRIQKKDSSESLWHLLRAIPVIENNEVKKWVGTFTDIDEQKQQEKRKDEFIGIASHELKTPLTSIKAYFQLMERTLGEGKTTEAQKFVAKCSAQLDRLGGLVTDLLDVSKIQSGKIRFTRKVFDFDSLLDSAVESIQQTNPSHTIKKFGRTNAKVYADSHRIEQVIINYLTNAIKYSPGQKEVHVESKVNENNEVQVRVKDFGIGIPREKAGKLFQKFYRVEDSDKFQGLGIGLFICAEIINRHEGKFWVETEPGKGSEFFFTLPVSE